MWIIYGHINLNKKTGRCLEAHLKVMFFKCYSRMIRDDDSRVISICV